MSIVVEKLKDVEIDIVVGSAMGGIIVAYDLGRQLGKSAYEAIRMVEEYGGGVVGIACLADKSKGDLKYSIYGGTKLEIKTYDLEDCPLCKEGLPIVKPGNRRIK